MWSGCRKNIRRKTFTKLSDAFMKMHSLQVQFLTQNYIQEKPEYQ